MTVQILESQRLTNHQNDVANRCIYENLIASIWRHPNDKLNECASINLNIPSKISIKRKARASRNTSLIDIWYKIRYNNTTQGIRCKILDLD